MAGPLLSSISLGTGPGDRPGAGTVAIRHGAGQGSRESVFATVRHRTARTKGALSATTVKLMVFKLIAAAKTWRRLKGEISCRKSSEASNSKRHRGHRSAGSPRRLIKLVTQSPA
jgi:hypothetical protein